MVPVKIEQKTDEYIGKNKEPDGEIGIEYADKCCLTAGTRPEIGDQRSVGARTAGMAEVEDAGPYLEKNGQTAQN